MVVPNYEAAAQRASDNLRKLLERECEPVPCPKCGWFQRDMVKRVWEARYRPLFLLLWGLLGTVGAVVGPASFLAIVSGAEARERISYLGLFLLWGGFLATAGVLLTLKFLLVWRFDPNALDIESRIQLSRELLGKNYQEGKVNRM